MQHSFSQIAQLTFAWTLPSFVQVQELDVASFSSIRRFCKQWTESGRKLDCLVNNAGIFSIVGKNTNEGKATKTDSQVIMHYCVSRHSDAIYKNMLGWLHLVPCSGSKALTADGFEAHLGTNYLGASLLTLLLLPALRKTVWQSSLPRLLSLLMQYMSGRRRACRADYWVCLCNQYLTAEELAEQVIFGLQGTAKSPARVIFVSSVVHFCSSKLQRDDMNFDRAYSSLRAYGHSKLAQVSACDNLSSYACWLYRSIVVVCASVFTIESFGLQLSTLLREAHSLADYVCLRAETKASTRWKGCCFCLSPWRVQHRDRPYPAKTPTKFIPNSPASVADHCWTRCEAI